MRVYLDACCLMRTFDDRSFPHIRLETLAISDAYELIAGELGVAGAMRFIARHSPPDGIDYTRDRDKWLSQDSKEVERLLDGPTPEFDRLVAESRGKKRSPGRREYGMDN